MNAEAEAEAEHKEGECKESGSLSHACLSKLLGWKWWD